MSVDWNSELAEQLDWHWREALRPRVDGLTDDEYFREPVPGMWSIRPRGTSTAAMSLGGGAFTMDYDRAAEPASYPMASLVLHINREALHHGAEVALLRDLYRWQP